MKKQVFFFTIALALVVSGCASTGNKVLKQETRASVAEKIVKGQSTKANIRAIYGDPMSTSFTDGGNEIWKYEFIKAHTKAASFIPIVNLFASGAEGDKKELVIMFNEDGIVRNYSMSTSKVDTNTSLFQ